MDSSPELAVTTHASAELDEYRQILLDVYEDVYREHLDDPFFSTSRYWERLRGYASRQGFGFTMGRLGSDPVGYALGYTLPAGSGWWRGLESDVDQIELNEDGHRTFALNEIMVLEQWRRRGFAHQLHDQLLTDRDEERATLLVLPDNAPAQAAYISWGWRKLGNLKPFDDSPKYNAMVLPLPIDPARRN